MSGNSLNTDSVHTSGHYEHSEEVKAFARRTVCTYATDSREAVMLMKMLGIYPGQDDELDMM